MIGPIHSEQNRITRFAGLQGDLSGFNRLIKVWFLAPGPGLGRQAPSGVRLDSSE